MAFISAFLSLAISAFVKVFLLDTITPDLVYNNILINAFVLPLPIADLMNNNSF